MKEIILRIPESVNLTEGEIRRFLAARLYESKKINLQQASELAQESQTDFVEILHRYGVEVVSDPLPERTRDAGQF